METPEERNRWYRERAADNIRRMTGECPQSEAEAKELMYKHLRLGSREETDLLYEFIEWIVADHHCKIHKD